MNGSDFGAMLRQAGQRLAAGDHRVAEAVLRQALAKSPGQPDALYMLGVALAMREAHGDAVAAFDGALRARPDFAQAMAQKSRSLDALDRRDEAVALAEAAGAKAQDP
jgi:protein O-GlcNAc transferase